MKVFRLAYFLFLLAAPACSSVKRGKFSYGKLPDNVLIVPGDTSADLLHRATVLVKATDTYTGGLVKRLLQGKNYRMAWDAPIEVPVLRMDTFRGGLKILEQGGGGQTYSLDVEDGQGRMMTLRSVTKDPSTLVPDFMRTFGLGNIIFDAISAGNPYGAIPAAKMADAAGVIHTHPKIYYVPKQPALDTLNDKYGNHLFLLEYEPEGGNTDWVTEVPRPKALLETEDVQEKLQASTLHRADQQELLRARLLDLVIGDWDRHSGNWGWVAYEKGDSIIYAPVAADRDNVFYHIGGVFPWLLTRPFFMPKFRPFRKKIYYLPGYLVNSKEFDPVFLNRMTRKDFLQAALDLQQMLTDESLEAAIRSWPDTIFQLNGPEIIEKIKARRDRLPKYASRFYKIMAKRPLVFGTDQSDHFIAEAAEGGNLRVRVFTQVNDASPAMLHYERIFSPKETKRICLIGLKGNDSFKVEKSVEKMICIVVIDGKKKPFRLKMGHRN